MNINVEEFEKRLKIHGNAVVVETIVVAVREQTLRAILTPEEFEKMVIEAGKHMRPFILKADYRTVIIYYFLIGDAVFETRIEKKLDKRKGESK